MPEVPSWTFPRVEIKVGIAKVNLSMPITFKELDSMKVRVWVLVLGRITLVVAMHRSFNLIKSCTGNWTGVFQLKLFEHWHVVWAVCLSTVPPEGTPTNLDLAAGFITSWKCSSLFLYVTVEGITLCGFCKAKLQTFSKTSFRWLKLAGKNTSFIDPWCSLCPRTD